MNIIANNSSLKVEYDNDEYFNDKIVFYFNKFWDNYEKILVLKSMDIEEYAILIKGVYCDIPKKFNKNNKIICYIVGIDKYDNKIETNKIVMDIERS